MFAIIYSHYLGKERLTEGFWVTNSWASLFIWLRLILYLQSTEMMSFIISMLLACFSEMIAFIVLLLMGVIAFADGIASIR